MKFTMEHDPNTPPKNGGWINGRKASCGPQYQTGGPQGSGGDAANRGPNSTTNGPAGQRIKGFTGSVMATGPKSAPIGARGGSNPMKR
jgi:hypothetical protein